jgi:LPS O-antigen subunit length determinant protein (WzzB/FepE family)
MLEQKTMTDIELELTEKINEVKSRMSEHEVGSVKHDYFRLQLSDLKEKLEEQRLPAQSFGNTCVSCEG